MTIFPLYVPWKNFETLTYVRNKPIDGFNAKVNCGSNRSINIREFFSRLRRMPILFVNLTAAYDTVISFKLDFNCKLLTFLLDKCVVRIIIKLVHNEGFTLTDTISKIISGVRETVFLQNQSRLFQHLDASSAFHNIQIKKKCELKVYSNQHSSVCLVPIYLEVKL